MLALLQAKYIFGVKDGVKNNIHFIDEHTIVYPCGIYVVIYHLDQRSQQLIPPHPKGRGITGLIVSPNRNYLAVAEKGDSRPFLSVYDTQTKKKLKTLLVPEIVATEYVSVAFAIDEKHLLAQGGHPDWIFTFWLWEKNRLLGSTCTVNLQNVLPIYQGFFHPFDQSYVGVIGKGVLKCFRFADGVFKPTITPKLEGINFTCVQWITDERIIAGTDNASIVIIDNFDPKIVLHIRKMMRCEVMDEALTQIEELPEFRLVPMRYPVLNLQVFSKGILVACGPGCVYYLEKAPDEKENFKQTKVISIPQDPSCADPSRPEEQFCLNLAISPTEESLIVCTDQLQIYSFHLSVFDLTKAFKVFFEILITPLHYKSVIDLDLAIRKQLVVTCSLDHSIRVWNYETNLEVLHKEYGQDVLSVCIHPTGHLLIAGFSDCIRVMTILLDDLRIIKEIKIKSCPILASSHGGHLFAALHGTSIQLYSTVTFELVQSLKGHHNKVTSFCWSINDFSLVSCGADGAVYEWNPTTGQRTSDLVTKGSLYLSVANSPDHKVSVVINADKVIREISESHILRQLSTKEVLTQVCLSHSGKYLFTSTGKGSVWSHKFPLSSISGDWLEFNMHTKAITKMKITFDDQYLVTVSEDASICIWGVVNREGHSLKRDKELIFSQETLISQSELEEKNAIIVDLKSRVGELQMENEFQMRLKDMKYADKMRDMTERFSQDMEGMRQKLKVSEDEKERNVIKYEEEMRLTSERFARETDEQESLANHKLILEYEKYNELQDWSVHTQTEFENKIEGLEASKKRALEELTEYYENKLKDKIEQLDTAREQSQTLYLEQEEAKKQIEEDTDREILDIKIKYEKKLKEERESNQKLKAEAALLKKKFLAMQKEIDEQKLNIQRGFTEHQKLGGVIKNLEKDITTLKNEIAERDGTIQDKENKIYDLKKKNQELEKFKFVLDYKIKELKKQLDPKDEDIRQMKEQVAAMEIELNRFRMENENLELEITQLKQKIRVLDKEMKEERIKAHDVETSFDRLKSDIYKCVGFLQNTKQLKQSIKSIYQRHVFTKKPGDYLEDDLDVMSEHMRQREHLEKTVVSLRKKLTKDTKLHYSDYFRIMKQNVGLIKEINDLRQELKAARAQLTEFEKLIHFGIGPMNRFETQAKLQAIKSGRASTAATIEMDKIVEIQVKEPSLPSQQETQIMQMSHVRSKSLSVSKRDKLPSLN